MTRCSKIQNLGFIAVFAFCILLVASFTVYAQGIPANGSGDLSVSLSNDNPIPGQIVTVTVRSFNINIDSATVSWSVNGKVAQKGIGLTTFDVAAPQLGKTTTIEISAALPDGTTVQGATAIGSGAVDMVIESNGYTPALFPGKSPIVYQNAVSIIAVPHIASSNGVEYDAKNLIYQWKKNDQVLEAASGYGKQVLKVTDEVLPRPYTINVTVSTRDNGARAVGYTTVTPQAPDISFYVNDPLYGAMFNRAIGDTLRIGSQQETGVLAVPFGISPGFTSSWLINGTDKPEIENKNSIILRSPGGDSGSSLIHLDISHPKYLLQGGSSEFNAAFSAGSDTNNANAPVLLNLLSIPTAYAATSVPVDQAYTLLEPLPKISSNGTVSIEESVPLTTYIKDAINLLIALSAVAAVFMIVWGGFEYMTTDSWEGKSAGRKKAVDAVIGLIMVLSTYLILRTVNPNLVNIATIPPICNNSTGLPNGNDCPTLATSSVDSFRQLTTEQLTQAVKEEATRIAQQAENQSAASIKNGQSEKLTLQQQLIDVENRIQSPTASFDPNYSVVQLEAERQDILNKIKAVDANYVVQNGLISMASTINDIGDINNKTVDTYKKDIENVEQIRKDAVNKLVAAGQNDSKYTNALSDQANVSTSLLKIKEAYAYMQSTSINQAVAYDSVKSLIKEVDDNVKNLTGQNKDAVQKQLDALRNSSALKALDNRTQSSLDTMGGW